jgi:serine acetyltransferase
MNSTIKHKVKIGNRVIIGSSASVINNFDDEVIVAKSIKHKVRSNQLFLMAGHRSIYGTIHDLDEECQRNNTISIEP